MEMIEEARKLWMESMYEDGNEIPLPSNQVEYSGKFNVRVPASLHRKLASLAVKEGVSLNQYIVYALSIPPAWQKPNVLTRKYAFLL